jgi:hypothetical protein
MGYTNFEVFQVLLKLIRTSFFSLDFSNIFDENRRFVASWPLRVGERFTVLAEYRALWGPQDGAKLLQKLGP